MPTPATPVLPEALVRGIKQLDPLPLTAQRLVGLLSRDETGAAAIADLIEFDQAIAAAVLRAAATARHAGYGVPTVRDAVRRLGTVALLDLVLDGYLKKIQVATPLYDLSEQDLWLHGAAAQLAVRALAAERPRAGIPALAGTAALLHDVGKLIVSRYLKADVRELLAHAEARRITFVEAERDIIGTDHAEVGAALAVEWKFPAEVADAIRRHHSLEFTNPTMMLDVVAVANVVAKTIAVGLGAEGLNFTVDPGSCRRLRLDYVALGRVCLQTDAWLGEVTRLHGVKR